MLKNKINMYALLLISMLMGAMLIQSSLMSMFGLWVGTDTYMHGLFVGPLCWMLYRQSNTTNAHIPPKTFSVIALIALWFMALSIAKMSLFNVLQQLVFLLFLPLAVYATSGLKHVWEKRVPLTLSFLCIPFGDSFVPYLQSITADMSVWMLQLSGVSVWRQGWYISIPNADFRVAEACSGVNFLISTFVLSVFFSFMEMKSWVKRIIFSILGVFIPIIANGIRVYLIIMIADAGHVEAATGFDHLVYGWVFFLIVILLLGCLGWTWRDRRSGTERAIHKSTPKTPIESVQLHYLYPTIFIFICCFIWSSFTSEPVKNIQWEKGRLQPSFSSADSYCYQSSGYEELHIISYESENEKKKILSIDNRWFSPSTWSVSKQAVVDDGSGVLSIHLTLKSLSGNEGYLWARYVVGESIYASTIEAKLELWKNRILMKQKGGSVHLWFSSSPSSVPKWGLCKTK